MPRAESVVMTVSIYRQISVVPRICSARVKSFWHSIQIHDIKRHCPVGMSQSQIPWQTNPSGLHCGSKVNSHPWFMAGSVVNVSSEGWKPPCGKACSLLKDSSKFHKGYNFQIQYLCYNLDFIYYSNANIAIHLYILA